MKSDGQNEKEDQHHGTMEETTGKWRRAGNMHSAEAGEGDHGKDDR